MQNNKRTIESILDLMTGKEVFASDLLSKSLDEVFKLRYEFETGIREKTPRFVCFYCKQAIKLRGQPDSKRIFHFAHLRDSEECLSKTNNKFSKEDILRIKYNGAKESCLHIELKTFIADSLRLNCTNFKGVEFVSIEKINKHQAIPKVWKKPDITSIYFGKNVVFELQLSTTFLSVINSRQEFYRENKTYIIWIFNSFETDEDQRKFTQSDVFYNNNRNGFEINEESKQQSILAGDLILKCYYERPKIRDENIIYEWESVFISLSDLLFDPITYKVYYYDVEGNSKRLDTEIQLKKSPLIKLIYEGEYSDIYKLFAEGYKYSESEKRSLIQLYKIHVSSELKIITSSIGFRVIIATICLKLESKELIQKLNKSYSHKHTLICILGLKLDKIIGYNVKNKIQVSYFLLGQSPEHIKLYLKAISTFQPNYLYVYDKKQKFGIRAQESIISKEQLFDSEIIFKIFPELGEKR